LLRKFQCGKSPPFISANYRLKEFAKALHYAGLFIFLVRIIFSLF